MYIPRIIGLEVSQLPDPYASSSGLPGIYITLTTNLYWIFARPALDL